jgi:hypothetical protein
MDSRAEGQMRRDRVGLGGWTQLPDSCAFLQQMSPVVK